MEFYSVKQLSAGKEITVSVPSSKSILNRALLLAAFTEGDTRLLCEGFGDDTRTLLSCLSALGIKIECVPDGVLVHGTRELPRTSAALNVSNAGTVARFLTAALAMRGGEYVLHSSEQMKNRPMELLSTLEMLGVRFDYMGKHGHFPFCMHSEGVNMQNITCNTDASTQFASGFLLAAAVGNHTCSITLTGERTQSSYIRMTAELIAAFGGNCTRNGETYTVTPISNKPHEFEIESDISGACYFYALSLLCGAKVTVQGVKRESLQGDARFLDLLEKRGVRLIQTPNGLLADGDGIINFDGFEEAMQDFSDQALTVAALAPFAATPTKMTGLAHIRSQECDRLHAIEVNLTALGVPCQPEGDNIVITPMPVKSGIIQTFNDHRVAMAFTLVGLKAGGITIENPACCTKTFDNYFKLIDMITAL